MSTYIGKIQIGNNESSRIPIGSTLFGICDTPASTADKQVTLNDFDTATPGVTIHVKFTYGNTVANNVTLAVGQVSAITIGGNCICGTEEVLSFTLDSMNSPTNMSSWIWHANTSSTAYATAAQGTAADNAMPRSGGTFTGEIIVPSVNNNSSSGAAVNKSYVDSIVNDILGSADAMVFKGTIGASTETPAPTITSLPQDNYQAGWTYKVITAGTYAGKKCEVGDLLISISDFDANQSTDDDWTVVQNNVDSAVYKGSNIFTDGKVVITDGNNGQVKDSGLTIGTSVPSDAVFTDHQYQLTTNANAYTGTTSYDSSNLASKVLVSVSGGVLQLEEGITFTTTAVGTALVPASGT